MRVMGSIWTPRIVWQVGHKYETPFHRGWNPSWMGIAWIVTFNRTFSHFGHFPVWITNPSCR